MGFGNTGKWLCLAFALAFLQPALALSPDEVVAALKRPENSTGNIADAVGLGAALEYVERIGIEAIGAYEHGLLDYATHHLRPIPGVRLVGTARDKASVLSFVLDGYSTDEVGQALNREGIDIAASPVSAEQLSLLLKRIADGTISNKIAKEVFAGMWEAKSASAALADEIIEAKGLKQISDTGALEKIVDEVLAANAKSVEEYRAGKEKAFNALIGQAMKATKGKANPAQLTELLKQKLG